MPDSSAVSPLMVWNLQHESVPAICDQTYFLPNWKPIDYDGERSAAQERIECGSCDTPLLRHTPRDGGVFALEVLHPGPDDDCDSKNNESRDNTAFTPLPACAAPLKCQYERDDGPQKDDSPNRVELSKLLPPAHLLEFGARATDVRQAEEYESEDDGTDRQVDVEAPGMHVSCGPLR